MYHTINSANKYFRKSSFLNLTPASQSHLQLACLVIIIDIQMHSTESGSGLSFCLILFPTCWDLRWWEFAAKFLDVNKATTLPAFNHYSKQLIKVIIGKTFHITEYYNIKFTPSFFLEITEVKNFWTMWNVAFDIKTSKSYVSLKTLFPDCWINLWKIYFLIKSLWNSIQRVSSLTDITPVIMSVENFWVN